MELFVYTVMLYVAFISSFLIASPSLDTLNCGIEISILLKQWAPHPNWTDIKTFKEGLTLYKTPTDEIGNWVELKIKRNEAHAYKITPHEILHVEWDSLNCTPKIVISPLKFDENLMKQAFTDKTLETLLAKTNAGLIYAWSPHMPYSIKGMETISKVATKLGLTLIYVLDPDADLKRALELGSAKKLSANSYRKIESYELLNRGITTHFPALLVFSKGKIKGPVYPGLKSDVLYESFIKEKLVE